jgi:Flp pilus assembly protein TadG
MMQPPKPAFLAPWVRRFARDSRGAVAIEFVLVMPFLFWAFMAVYVYFDGYRQSTVNLKAAYTIGDLVSRETEAINPAYIDSMYDLHKLLTRASSATTLRISIVRWSQPDARYYLDWTQSRGGVADMTNEDLVALASRLPTMPNNERVIVVETTNRFVPLFAGVGMEPISLDNFVFTRPRFAPQIKWKAS